jgi:hypothetical protein
MKTQEKSPAREGEAVNAALAGCADTAYTLNNARGKSNRQPCVIVSECGASAFVALVNRPWGWPNLDKEFFSLTSAQRYAEGLRTKIRLSAQKEELRKARLKDAARREAFYRAEELGRAKR